MKCITSILLMLAVAAIVGCGAKQDAASAAPVSDAATASPASGGVLAKSRYDEGPRAAEAKVDAGLAKLGGPVFQTHGCPACHGWGVRLSGPDLKGVTMRRTAQWMENQILHPDVMAKQDPISHGLLATYSLQMPNQGLTNEQARQVIEYLKKRDHDSK